MVTTWKTSRRAISFKRPLVMGILNVTPDSFSDGGKFNTVDKAIERAERIILDGADIIDIGGESTRPGSLRVSAHEEIERVVPIVKAIAARFDIPLSIDTSKAAVARAAIDAGAEIINDISGLRWEPEIADIASTTEAGLVLMHSRGEFETMHSQPPVDDLFNEVANDFRRSTSYAISKGVGKDQIVLDIGIGFGKTPVQNVELLGKVDRFADKFSAFPILVGASRKSFLGKLLEKDHPDDRVSGSVAAAAIAVFNGSKIVRVHDIRETVDALSVATAIRDAAQSSGVSS